MEIYRICDEAYSKEITSSGNPNRWNAKEQFVVYASSSRSLATLELVVHRNSIKPHKKYRVMIISVADDEDLIEQFKIKELPKNWRKIAAYSRLQKMGSSWYKNQESLILKVPSAVIKQEYNYVINTKHPDFKKENIDLIRTEAYFWDKRLAE